MVKYNSILLMGPGGSGKSTQGALLESTGRFAYISSRDVVRTFGDKTYLKKQFTENMGLNNYDSANRALLGMIEGTISRRILAQTFNPASQKLCVDGFPRYWAQVYLAEKLLDVEKVISIQVPEEISKERIAKRGENGERPKDQKPDFIDAKLGRFYNHTIEVVNHYAKKGLIVEIDGTSSESEVHIAIMKCLGLA